MNTPTISSEYVWRWQCDPAFDAFGNVVGTPLQVFYRRDLDLGDGSPIQYIGTEKMPSLTVDLAGHATKTVTVGDKSYTYGELVAALIAAIGQERMAQ